MIRLKNMYYFLKELEEEIPFKAKTQISIDYDSLFIQTKFKKAGSVGGKSYLYFELIHSNEFLTLAKTSDLNFIKDYANRVKNFYNKIFLANPRGFIYL